MTSKLVRTGLVVALLVAISNGALAQGGNRNPGVVPPNANFKGLSYSEWAAKSWQEAYGLPVVDGDHPFLSGGVYGGEDGVAYLAGPLGAPAVVEITIPTGTPLLFSVLAAECSQIEPDPFHGDTVEELLDCANGHIDNTSGLFASIDGKPINNLEAYRVDSVFGLGPLPADNLLGAPEGATSLAAQSGYFLMLNPLSRGRHVIHVQGTFDQFDVSADVMFLITVVPGK